MKPKRVPPKKRTCDPAEIEAAQVDPAAALQFVPGGEYFRGVVWPRAAIDGAHRYTVIGMLITDKPIESFEAKHEIVLSGMTFGLADILNFARQCKPSRRLGDANHVLMSLKDITDGEPA